MKTVGKQTGQKVADFQTGKTKTPLVLGVDEIFFHAGINFPIGGQTIRHSLAQLTQKASVADEPG